MLLLYFAFILTGILTALPGPLLPVLLKRWPLTDAQAGSVIAAQFLSNMVGAIFANRNLRVSLVVGLATMAAGTFGLTVLPWPFFRIAVICYGVGLGLAIPAINLTVAAREPAKRAASLNLLNGVWGIGAISSPALIFLAQKFASINALLVALALISALLFVAFIQIEEPLRPQTPHVGIQTQAGGGHVYPLKYFAVMFFFYVGAETCIASWINVYAERTHPGAAVLFFSPVMCFWAALILGRTASARFLRWVSDASLYMFALAFALVAFALLIAGRSSGALILGSILCGFTLAPIFPLLLAFASESMLARPNSGWVMACASLGGALLPWTTGVISTSYRLRIGLLIPGVAIVALLVLGIRIVRHINLTFVRRTANPPIAS